MRLYVLYGFGILLCLGGIGYLAEEYVKYMSEIGKLLALLLTIGMFSFLGKYFQELGE